MDGNESSYVFISHAHVDARAANEILRALEARGIPCWIDKKNIPLGQDYEDEIAERIDEAAAVILVESPASVASQPVLDELKLAKLSKKDILRIEIAVVQEWKPRWRYLTLKQMVSRNDPAWADLVATHLRKTGGFGSDPATANAADSPSRPAQGHPTRDTASNNHSPLAVISSDGRTRQLDGLNGLGQTQIDSDDEFSTGDLGLVAVSPDAAVIATSHQDGTVDLWTPGGTDAMAGPALSNTLPSDGVPRLLAVDRPLGQAIRVIASDGPQAYSLVQDPDGTWTAMSLARLDEPIVSGAVVKDDVLFVDTAGMTIWASSRARRPFSLPRVRGVDAAVGADGRCYLAGWGDANDDSHVVEVVVEADDGWERLSRTVGNRAGIVRTAPDLVLQRREATQTAVAIEADDGAVTMVRLV